MNKLIKIHSVIDIITNSSTEIFTYSHKCEAALKEMINEIFKTFNINKSCDDVFDMVVLCDKEIYDEYFDGLSDEKQEELGSIDVGEIYNDVLNGVRDKPDWFIDAENEESEWSGLKPENYLCLIPKNNEYKNLAKLVIKFLYSPSHEAYENR